MRRRWISIGAASLLGVVSAVAAAAAPETPEARWNAVAACGSRNDERQRHACVDDVLRQAGVLNAEQDRRDERQRFGREPAPPPPPKIDEPDRLGAKLTDIAEGRNGFLTLTTDDGTVWRQTEAREDAQRPKAGQTLNIRKALSGTYLCQIENRAVFRCTRSR
ncbi:MAG: hypothetical protein ABW136_00460 [Steroidobacteraceae bacterium]